MFSSFISGFTHSSLYLTNSQFSHIILPAILLSNNEESTIIRDLNFHTKKQDIDSDLTLINCTFTFCSLGQTNEIKGGAIYIDNLISLQTKNCIFRKNQVRNYGSAIYARNATLIDIDNCLFAENVCKRSGPIYLIDVGEVIIQDTNFTQNKSKLGSGAITLSNIEKKAELTNILFFENTGRLFGTLFCNNTDVEINHCFFYFNHFTTGPSSIKLQSNTKMLINNTIFAEDNSLSILLYKSCTLNISNCSFSNSESESIRNRSGKCFIDNATVFKSIIKHDPIQLDPLEDIEINRDNSSKRNRRNIKKLNNESNKELDKENNKELDKENNKELNKENNKELNKENNKEAVVVKHGNKNQSFVLYPIQEKLNRKYSIFPLSFLIGIALIFVLVIFFACCKDAREKMLIESVGDNYSIFNHDDLNSNTDTNNFTPQNEKLSDLNINDLPSVKMEKF